MKKNRCPSAGPSGRQMGRQASTYGEAGVNEIVRQRLYGCPGPLCKDDGTDGLKPCRSRAVGLEWRLTEEKIGRVNCVPRCPQPVRGNGNARPHPQC